MRKPLGRGMGPVRSRKGVIAIDIAQGRKLVGKTRVIPFFAGMKPGVFQKQNIPRGKRRNSLLGQGADTI